MIRKFFYLVKISFNKKLKSKWFIAVNVILAIAMFALFNLNSIITFFGGDFDKSLEILVYDKTNISYDYLKNNLTNLANNLDEDKLVIKQVTENKKELKDDEILITLNIDDKLLSASVTSEKKIDQDIYQLIYQSLNSTKQQVLVEKLNLDSNTLAMLSNSINIDRIVLSDKKTQDENMSMIMSTVFPSLILPFFMLIIFLVQMVGGEICEEKTTKSMEIIISNVSPKTHFISKVLASNLFVLIQGGLVLLFAFIGLGIRYFMSGGNLLGSFDGEIQQVIDGISLAGVTNTLTYMIPIIIVMVILTFLAYSLLAGILASMTTNQEDFQQLQAPIVIVSLIGFYLSMMAGLFKGSIFIKIMSYIPFVSAMLSPTLYLMGEVGLVDLGISIILLVGTIYLLIKYGLRIYKVGILNYSQSGLWKKMFRAMKDK